MNRYSNVSDFSEPRAGRLYERGEPFSVHFYELYRYKPTIQPLIFCVEMEIIPKVFHFYEPAGFTTFPSYTS